MSLRTRLILLSSLWILLIVVVFNVSLYFYISASTTLNETKLLWKKAQIILRNPEIHDSSNWTKPELLEDFKEPDMMVRIIAPNRDVVAGISTHVQLSGYPVVFRSNYYTDMVNDFGFRMLFLQVPIYDDDRQIGQLELGKALNVVSEWMKQLGTGLVIATGGVLAFALISGLVYTQIIIRPIRELLESMKAVRRNRTFVTLSPKITSQKDELGKLGQTFNEMIEALREHDEKQKQFVADASHELRTPLTVIESYTSLLHRWGANDPALREEALQAIQAETSRLKGLIQALLRLAELERMEAEISFQPVEAVALMRETAGRLSVAFERDLVVDAADERIVCWGEPEPLKQLFVIVLDNAVKYSRRPVRIRLSRERSEAVIVVKDEGIGIPEADIPHLFERFYRVDKMRHRSSGGTGLGLSIAKQIVERHNGSIRIRSRETRGTEVEIRLPLAEESS
ncbi:cell wall metabolism sensor histidine kinase WalK [Paenibacillus sp. EPM92]|uniref:sensor histidine kinase n=1 Tax=Paenibacillus sp. EPM92 TaxID=1561195 RepID=UPI001915117C|nr:HAMP domain-containing sensor histidine kinase [Paenibacillus sp. EPM92]